MSYDRSKTMFSPEGHLLQVQYAHRAAQNGSIILALSNGSQTVLLAEQRLSARLQQKTPKIHPVSVAVSAVFSGLTADARLLLQHARIFAASSELRLAKTATAEDVARQLGELMQKNTQQGGKRAFGACGIVIEAGKIFSVDPSGVVMEWKAVAIGNNQNKIQGVLEEKWKGGMAVEEMVRVGKEVIGEVVEGEEYEVFVAE